MRQTVIFWKGRIFGDCIFCYGYYLCKNAKLQTLSWLLQKFQYVVCFQWCGLKLQKCARRLRPCRKGAHEQCAENICVKLCFGKTVHKMSPILLYNSLSAIIGKKIQKVWLNRREKRKAYKTMKLKLGVLQLVCTVGRLHIGQNMFYSPTDFIVARQLDQIS